ncbi:hypothetical protein [Dishui Lake virophage 2]|nr:hypothetical protein [Dishui Lake virophage 2]
MSERTIGGKLSLGNLKGLLNKSYDSKKPKNYQEFEVDKELSGQRVQVYKNPKTGQVIVSHRGTQGIHDIGNDLKYALGMDLSKTKRFKHAEDIQRKAEAKYGAENISTIGHSLGAKIARDVGQNTKEVIQLNPAYNIPDAKKKTSEKTHTIRTQYDPVSFLQPKSTKNVTTLESTTLNPLKEHTVDVLDRGDAEMEVGQGLVGMGMKDLKKMAKALPKHQKIKLTKIKKADLIAHLKSCKCGGASQLQKGMASNMRGYFDEGTDQKRALNQIIHSGDPNPAPSIFNDITNSYDPNVDAVIEAYYEHYLYNWYAENGHLKHANEDGLSSLFYRDKDGTFKPKLKKDGKPRQLIPPTSVGKVLGYPNVTPSGSIFNIPARGVLDPPVLTPYLREAEEKARPKPKAEVDIPAPTSIKVPVSTSLRATAKSYTPPKYAIPPSNTNWEGYDEPYREPVRIPAHFLVNK